MTMNARQLSASPRPAVPAVRLDGWEHWYFGDSEPSAERPARMPERAGDGHEHVLALAECDDGRA